jgi:hypothetical protein
LGHSTRPPSLLSQILASSSIGLPSLLLEYWSPAPRRGACPSLGLRGCYYRRGAGRVGFCISREPGPAPLLYLASVSSSLPFMHVCRDLLLTALVAASRRFCRLPSTPLKREDFCECARCDWSRVKLDKSCRSSQNVKWCNVRNQTADAYYAPLSVVFFVTLASKPCIRDLAVRGVESS